MQHYKLYSRLDTRETYFETWGGSTKHPDTITRLSDFKLVDTSIIPVHRQLFQFLLFVASNMLFPGHAREIAEYALELENSYIESFNATISKGEKNE